MRILNILHFIGIICNEILAINKTNNNSSNNNKFTLDQVTIHLTSEVDKKRYMEILKDPRVSSNHTGRYSTRQEQIQHNDQYWLNKKRMQKNCYKMYKIVCDGNIVGYIEFYPDSTDNEVAYIAYSVDPKYWNRGIATIAIRKQIRELKEELKSFGVKKIYATVRITNKGSIIVLQKNGFKIIDEKFFADCPVKVLELIL